MHYTRSVLVLVLSGFAAYANVEQLRLVGSYGGVRTISGSHLQGSR